MTTSIPLASLGDWLGAEVAAGDEASTAILAGHFAIFSGGGRAVDLLDAPHPAGGPAEMLAFTRFSWDAACHALAHRATDGARLLVLVDDIQFIIPVLKDQGAQEKLAAALAAGYLEETPALPAFHARALTEHGLSHDRVLKRSADRWLFSERELRVAHVRRLKELVRTRGEVLAGLTVSADLSHITVTSAEHGEYCLVHSGRTTCAGGYVELLCAAQERGIRRLITLFPMRCLGPVTLGTALGTELMNLEQLTVVNVAIPDVASGVAAAVSRTSGRSLASPRA